MDEKDKAYIKSSGKYSYITVCYLVIRKSEEVEMDQCREVSPVKVTGYRSGNHHGITGEHMLQEESISGIEPCSQSNALYASILVFIKANTTWTVNYRKVNTSPHPFGISMKKSEDKGKVCLRECLPRKARGEYMGNQLNLKYCHVLFFQ